MLKFVILGIIFIVVFLAGYLTIWKHILKPLNSEGERPSPKNSEPKCSEVKTDSTKEGESNK